MSSIHRIRHDSNIVIVHAEHSSGFRISRRGGGMVDDLATCTWPSEKRTLEIHINSARREVSPKISRTFMRC